MNPVIIAAAILPIVSGLTKQGQSDEAYWLDLGSWFIFVADFVVHLRWKRGYLRSRLGRFDLTIVILTAPWYLIPGFGNTRVLGVAGLGRLGRVFIVSTKSSLLQDLGGASARRRCTGSSSCCAAHSSCTGSSRSRLDSRRTAMRCGGPSSRSPQSATATWSP